MSLPTLVTISFSHYCEKARWALDRGAIAYREEAHAPILHLLATVPRRGRSTPLLRLGGRSLTDSRDIVRFVESERPGLLVPSEPAQRADVEALEARFDRDLGPAARRVAYHAIFSSGESLAPMLRSTTTGLTRALAPLVARTIAPMIQRGLRIDAEGARRSQLVLDAVLDEVDARLADGRRYLVGGRFTLADLTFASLLSPLLAPAEQPVTSRAETPMSIRPLREAVLARPSGRFAERLYREERRVRPG